MKREDGEGERRKGERRDEPPFLQKRKRMRNTFHLP